MNGLRAGLAAAIPLLLLLQADDVRMLTRLERDGSGLRVVWCQGNRDRLQEVETRLRDATADFEDQQKSVAGQQFMLSRSWRPHALTEMPECKMDISDLVKSPLSLYSTYTWEETLKIESATTTAGEKLGGQGAKLLYVLEMPGEVDPTSVSPTAEADGGKVAWTLTGDKDEYTLRATSRALRWDILLIVLFVLAVVAGKVGGFVYRTLLNRPKRI